MYRYTNILTPIYSIYNIHILTSLAAASLSGGIPPPSPPGSRFARAEVGSSSDMYRYANILTPIYSIYNVHILTSLAAASLSGGIPPPSPPGSKLIRAEVGSISDIYRSIHIRTPIYSTYNIHIYTSLAAASLSGLGGNPPSPPSRFGAGKAVGISSNTYI